MAIEPDRFISPTQDSSEAGFDRALRPVRLAEYIGQAAVKEQMTIFVEAAKKRSVQWLRKFFIQPWKIFSWTS
jgi:Holliday junction DNA helicase RuvB